MSKATRPARFLPAVCPCGTSFDREVKRGRPQVWCPTCLAVPFYERQRSHVDAAGEVVVKAKPTGETSHDKLAHVRSEIEAEIAEINVDHKIRFAAMLADGVPMNEVTTIVNNDTANAYRAVYSKYSGAGVAVEVIVEDEAA